MKDYQDAFGHEVYDYYLKAEKEKGGSEIIERDDGFFDSGINLKIYFSEYKDWPPQLKKAMRYARGRVIDIGCGAGRHSLYLQEKGFDVLGIDISPLAIKVCKLRGLKKAKVMSITQISSKLGKFDTILMLGNNFGLFGSFKRAKWLLKRFHNITNDGARIIAQSHDPYNTDDPDHLKYHEFNRRRDRMGGQIRLRVRYRKYVTPWFDYLFVSKDELGRIIEGTGWRVKDFIDAESSGYLAIIEKEGSTTPH